MEHPEIDPTRLLAEIDNAEERARTARAWGMLDGNVDHLFQSGRGPQAALNRAITGEKRRRRPTTTKAKPKSSRKPPRKPTR